MHPARQITQAPGFPLLSGRGDGRRLSTPKVLGAALATARLVAKRTQVDSVIVDGEQLMHHCLATACQNGLAAKALKRAPCLIRPLRQQRRDGVIEAVNDEEQRCAIAAAKIEQSRLLLVREASHILRDALRRLRPVRWPQSDCRQGSEFKVCTHVFEYLMTGRFFSVSRTVAMPSTMRSYTRCVACASGAERRRVTLHLIHDAPRHSPATPMSAA